MPDLTSWSNLGSTTVTARLDYFYTLHDAGIWLVIICIKVKRSVLCIIVYVFIVCYCHLCFIMSRIISLYHWYLDALGETRSKFSGLWPVYTIMKLLPWYLRATNTPGDTREKISLVEPGLTYERTSSQSELARCGINYQKRWLWQKTSTHSCDYWTSTGKTTPADTIIR